LATEQDRREFLVRIPYALRASPRVDDYFWDLSSKGSGHISGVKQNGRGDLRALPGQDQMRRQDSDPVPHPRALAALGLIATSPSWGAASGTRAVGQGVV
jgi:hypothetical protein